MAGDPEGLAKAPPPKRSMRSRVIWRGVLLTLTAVGLYVVWPSLLETFTQFPELRRIQPVWFVIMLVFEAVSFVSAWLLLRLTLHERSWFLVGTAQLAGNAFSRIVPAGAAMGGALQFRMLQGGGVDGTAAASGLAAASLMSTAMLAALPILAVPAMLLGAPVPRDLRVAAVLGVAVFLVLVALAAVLLFVDTPLAAVGSFLQRLRNFLSRGPDSSGLPERLLHQRDAIAKVLGAGWRRAVVATAGNWLLDFLALLTALAAVGARPRPSLVLLAYVLAVVLGMIPITPGGLGFVEAGLTATLVLAGVSAGDAALATLAYRLVSYWLPLPAGAVAYLLYQRRYGLAPAREIRAEADAAMEPRSPSA